MANNTAQDHEALLAQLADQLEALIPNTFPSSPMFNTNNNHHRGGVESIDVANNHDTAAQSSPRSGSIRNDDNTTIAVLFNSSDRGDHTLSSSSMQSERFHVSVSSSTTFQAVLDRACAYYDLNSEEFALCEERGTMLPLMAVVRDTLPPGPNKIWLRRIKTIRTDGDDNNMDTTTTTLRGEGDRSTIARQDGGGGGGGPGGAGGGTTNPDKDFILPPSALVKVRHGESDTPLRWCMSCEIFILLFLAVALSTVSLKYRRVNQTFQANDAMSNQILPNASAVRTIDDLWIWTQQSSRVATTLMALPGANLAQLRVTADTNCLVPTPFMSLSFNEDWCAASWSTTTQSRAPIPRGSNLLDDTTNNSFVFGSGVEVTQWPMLVSSGWVPGQWQYYPLSALGYAYYLQPTTLDADLTSLQMRGWIDNSTRVVVWSADFYDAASSSVTDVIALFELVPSGGAVIGSLHATTIYTDIGFLTSFYYILAALITAVIVMGFFLTKDYGIRRMAIDAWLVIFFWLLAAGFAETQTILSTPHLIVDMRGVALQSLLLAEFTGCILVALAWKIFHVLGASPTAALLERAWQRMAQVLFSYMVLLIVVSTMFALMAHFIFGRGPDGYWRVTDLAFASLAVSYGPATLVGVSSWGAIVLSATAFFVFYFVMLFLAFAIVARAYLVVSDEVRNKGYVWMPGDASAKQYAQVMDLIGVVKGEEAEEVRRDFQAGGGKFEFDDVG